MSPVEGRSQRLLRPGWIALVAALVVAHDAGATWSIVAVDPGTGEVGLAAASCSVGVQHIAAVVPGKGAVAAQAATSRIGRETARDRIAAGHPARDVLEALRDPALYASWFRVGFPYLQYGVATLGQGSGNAVDAGFATGESNVSWAGGEAGEAFSVQGNTLRSAQVVEQAARAFREAGSTTCPVPLAERLLRALEAGRDAGGDKRCPARAPALAAILVVAQPDDSPDAMSLFEIAPRSFSIVENVWHMAVPYRPDPERPEPVAELRRRYEATGAREECP